MLNHNWSKGISLAIASMCIGLALELAFGHAKVSPKPVEVIPVEVKSDAVDILSKKIRDENHLEGTSEWQMTKSGKSTIEGYASSISVAPGQEVDFSVSTSKGQFIIDIFRLGWYSGKGGRKVSTSGVLEGHVQSPCNKAADTGLVDCDWTKSFTLSVPPNWISGVYLAKLTALSGEQNYIPFVVRGDRTDGMLVNVPFFTFQAYNQWGGESLYKSERPGSKRAYMVSFDRPFQEENIKGQLLDWDVASIKFLESKGYPVNYVTNLDWEQLSLDKSPPFGIISLGHDEYWSLAQRNSFDKAVGRGTHLAVFGANTGYWKVNTKPNRKGVFGRVIVCYKDMISDPVASTDPSSATVRFRFPPIGRPEAELLGIMYPEDRGLVGPTAPLQVESPDHWMFQGLTVHQGDQIPGGVGVEADAVSKESASGLTVLFRSPFETRDKKQSVADTTIYQHKSGAWVFASGSIVFGRLLDPQEGKGSSVIRIMIQNLLDRWISDRGIVHRKE